MSRRVLFCGVALCAALSLAACPEEEKRPIGATCGDPSECASGICAGGTCLDPDTDDDGDGLINGTEWALGSNPLAPDSDGDGIPDDEEVAGDFTNRDTDGDGFADILESATADLDSDCIPDELDAQNDVANSDTSPMIDVVCQELGVCAGQREHFAAVCPPDGEARCDYSAVPGFEDPEVTCDGLDQSCDGVADDGFPDGDGDGVADCVDDDLDDDDVTDDVDNCPGVSNGDQADADADGVGDACVADYELAFVVAPGDVTAGEPFGVTVALQDVGGAVVTRFVGDVTVGPGGDGGGWTLDGDATVTAVDGVATFAGLSVPEAGETFLMLATSGALGPAESDPFDVSAGDFAALVATGAPAQVAAGTAFSVTLTAYDALDNVDEAYRGELTFSSTDTAATGLPPDYTFTAEDAGAHTFEGLTLVTAGVQTVEVRDASDGTLLTAFDVTVTHLPAITLALTGLPGEVTAGEPPTLRVTALDPHGNVDLDYTGTVAFDTTDGAATPPPTHTFTTAEAGTFETQALVLRTAGPHSVTVTDTDDDTITATASTDVVHATAASLMVTVVTDPATAGEAATVEVTAVDAFGNLVTDYAGTVTFDSSDPLATLPPDYTFVAGDAGARAFSVTFVSSGAHTVTVTDDAGTPISGQDGVTVESGSDVRFELTGLPDPATAGEAFDVTVTVRDSFDNVVTDYAGTISLLTDDATDVLPPDVTLDGTEGGTVTFEGLELRTAGTRTLTARDADNGVANSVSVDVVAAAATHLALTGPATVVAGQAFTIEVTALDAFDNVADAYAGTVGFSADAGAQPQMPADAAFAGAGGVRTVPGAVLRKVGAWTVTARDVSDANVDGTLDVAVTPAAAARLALTDLPDTAVAGDSVGFTVTAYDSFDNLATNYTGTVAIEAVGDAQATPPPSHTFATSDAGSFDFAGLVLRTAGVRTVRASDAAATLAVTDTIDVTAAAAASLDVEVADDTLAAGSQTSVTVTARDAFGNRARGYRGTVALTTPDDQASLPAPYTFTAADDGAHVFGNAVVFRTVGTWRITATDTAAATITGTSGDVVVTEGTGVVYVLTALPATAVAGDDLGFTLTVQDPFDNVLTDYAGTVTFSYAPLQAPPRHASVPPNYTFTPGDDGVKAFTGFIPRAAGSVTLRATETGGTGVQASGVVSVSPAGMSALVITDAPTSATAGGAFGVEVTALDAFGNIATGYRGSVTFSSNDPDATLPAATAFTAQDAGVRAFGGLILEQAGAGRTVTVADGAATDTATLTVGHGAATTLVLSALPASVTAGIATSLSAHVEDDFGNPATAFSGTAAVTSPGDARFEGPGTIAIGGSPANFSVTFGTVGTQSVIVNGGGTLQASRSTDVQPGDAASLSVTTLPASVSAGDTETLSVTVLDADGNVVTDFAGTITVQLDDPQGSATPAPLVLDGSEGGTGEVDVTFGKAGTRTVTFGTGALPAVMRSTTVAPGAPTKLLVSALPTTMTAGGGATVSVRVEDDYTNVVRDYSGVVNLTPKPVSPGFPHPTLLENAAGNPVSSLTFPAGAASTTLDVTFFEAGAQHVDLTDTSLPAAGRTVRISSTVAPAAAAAIVATPASGTVTSGAPFDLTVTMRDAYTNVATQYAGTVDFVTSDVVPETGQPRPGVVLPGPFTFVPATHQGTHTFQGGFTLVTAGSQTVRTDGTGGVTSSTVTRTVQAGGLASLVVELSRTTMNAGQTVTATVTPRDAAGNVITGFSGEVRVEIEDRRTAAPAEPAAFMMTMSGVTTTSELPLYDAGTRTITVMTESVQGSDSVVVAPADFAAAEITTQPTDGEVDVTLPTFVVTLYDAYGNVRTGDSSTSVTAAIAHNAGRAHLLGTATEQAAAGVVRFDGVRLDRPGEGYLLRLTGPATLTTDAFDVTWRAPFFVGQPSTTGASGCTTLAYTVGQPNGQPVDVHVDYRVGAGTWRPATQLASSSVAGVTDVPASATGTGHKFVWNNAVDLGAVNVSTVSLRLRAEIDGVSSGFAEVSVGAVANGWDATLEIEPYQTDAVFAGLAVGDIDQNGLLDVVVPDGAEGEPHFVVVYAQRDGSWSEKPVVLDDITDYPFFEAAVGDLNRDGNPDVVLTTHGNIMVALSTVDAAGEVTFSWRDVSVCASESVVTTGLALADLNGDGGLDIVTTCQGDPSEVQPVFNYLWTEQPYLFAPRSWLETVGGRPNALATGDFDWDGDPDVAVAHDGGLTLLRTTPFDGEPVLLLFQEVEHGAGLADVVIGDVDYDADLDVVAATVDGDLAVFVGVSLRDAWVAEDATVRGSLPASSLALADLDADGRLDVVAGSYRADGVELFAGDGQGGFETAARWEIGGQTDKGVVGVFAGDFDRDGRPDVVAAREVGGWARLLGDAAHQCGADFDGPGSSALEVDASTVVVADVNRDGKPDMVTLADGVETPWRGVAVHYGRGDGRFDPYVRLATFEANGLAVGDVSGDGYPDIAVLVDTGGEADSLYVLLNPGAVGGNWGGLVLSGTAGATRGPWLADVDNDRQTDIIFANENQLTVRFQDDLTFPAAAGVTPVFFDNVRPDGVGLADLNGDGVLELGFHVGDDGDGGQVCVLLSTGARSWAAFDRDGESCVGGHGGLPIDSSFSPVGDVSLQDIDGDGATELLYATRADQILGAPTNVYVRQEGTPGSGVFDVLIEQAGACTGARDVQVGDLDRDGLAEVIVDCAPGETQVANGVTVYEQGADGLAPVAALGEPSYYSAGFALGDFDGDHATDVAYYGTTFPQADGAPLRFADADAFAYGDCNGLEAVLTLADVDGNGLVDVIAACAFSTTSVAADRTFVTLQTAPGEYAIPAEYVLRSDAGGTVRGVQAVGAGDLFADGRPDYVVAVDYPNAQQQAVYVFEPANGAPGDLSDGAFLFSTSRRPYAMEVDDMDGDGLDDIVLAGGAFTDHGFEYWRQSTPGSYQLAMGASLGNLIIAAIATGELAPHVANQCFMPPENEIAVATTGTSCGQSTACVHVLTRRRTFSSLAGCFAPAPALQVTLPVGHLIEVMTARDVDGDGLDDVVVAGPGDGWGQSVVTVFLQSSASPGTFTPTEHGPLPGEWRQIRVADVDHDGRADLVSLVDGVSGTGEPRTWVEVMYQTADDGTLGARVPIGATTERFSDLLLGDLDGDGRVDLAPTRRDPDLVRPLYQQ